MILPILHRRKQKNMKKLIEKVIFLLASLKLINAQSGILTGKQDSVVMKEIKLKIKN